MIGDNSPRAILLLLAATALLAAMDGLAKALAADIPVLQIVWARFFFNLVCLSPFLAREGLAQLVRTRRRGLQLLRGLMQLGGTVAFFTAIVFVPLADAVAVAFAAPLFVTLLAIPLLGERPGWQRWSALAGGFVGVMVVIRPGFGDPHWALLLSLVTALCMAAVQIVTRMLGSGERPMTTLFYTNAVALAAASLAVPFVWTDPTAAAWTMMLVLGLLGTIAHFLMILAFSTAPASTLAPFTYADIVWATLIGILAFAEIPSVWVLLGSSIIVATGLLAWRQETRPPPKVVAA